MVMKTSYVLVDYENVQPADLAALRDGSFKVKVFLGANQAKIPVALAAALQELGANAEYVRLQSSGSNALDFHIAYYIGFLSAEEPSASFHIISKDTGFDPLVKHLKTKGVTVQRTASLTRSSLSRSTLSPTGSSQIERVVAHLSKMKAAKPRAEKTLRSTMRALFKNELSDEQLDALFIALCKREFVKVDGTRISYGLPPGP